VQAHDKPTILQSAIRIGFVLLQLYGAIGRMDKREILRLLDEDRRGPAYDATVVEVLPELVRGRLADGKHHWIAYSSLDENNVDAVITRELEHYRELGAEFEWTVYGHDRPTDMLDRLRAHGFIPGACEAVMIYDLKAPADWMRETNIGSLIRVDRLEQVADFRAVAETVFDKDYSSTANELSEAIRTGSTQHRAYVAYADGKPVSVGRLYTHPKRIFAGLYGGGTIEEYRGRGIYRTVVAARARDAWASGARYLRVDALPTSRPILERMGFEKMTETWPCQWKP